MAHKASARTLHVCLQTRATRNECNNGVVSTLKDPASMWHLCLCSLYDPKLTMKRRHFNLLNHNSSLPWINIQFCYLIENNIIFLISFLENKYFVSIFVVQNIKLPKKPRFFNGLTVWENRNYLSRHSRSNSLKFSVAIFFLP